MYYRQSNAIKWTKRSILLVLFSFLLVSLVSTGLVYAGDTYSSLQGLEQHEGVVAANTGNNGSVKNIDATADSTEVQLEWDEFPGADYYRVYRKAAEYTDDCFIATAAYGSSLSPAFIARQLSIQMIVLSQRLLTAQV